MVPSHLQNLSEFLEEFFFQNIHSHRNKILTIRSRKNKWNKLALKAGYHECPDAVESKRGVVSLGEVDEELDGAQLQHGLLAGRELQQQVTQGGGRHRQHVFRGAVQDLQHEITISTLQFLLHYKITWQHRVLWSYFWHASKVQLKNYCKYKENQLLNRKIYKTLSRNMLYIRMYTWVFFNIHYSLITHS